jgi:hypothetical protein
LLLNKDDHKWTQKASAENGSQLLNLFDFTNAEDKLGIFLSTTRMGISFNDLDLKKTEALQFIQSNQVKIADIYENLFSVFNNFEVDRYGLYFEHLFTADEINNHKQLKLFRWFMGEHKSISDFEEINQRYSYQIAKTDSSQYTKIILQFSKVMNRTNKTDIKYLLTTDFQKYFPSRYIADVAELEAFSDENIKLTLEEYSSHLSELTTVEGINK